MVPLMKILLEMDRMKTSETRTIKLKLQQPQAASAKISIWQQLSTLLSAGANTGPIQKEWSSPTLFVWMVILTNFELEYVKTKTNSKGFTASSNLFLVPWWNENDIIANKVLGWKLSIIKIQWCLKAESHHTVSVCSLQIFYAVTA